MKRVQLLLGISVGWLSLSMAADGITTLALPQLVLGIGVGGAKATLLGMITFVGLLLGMLIQPIAGLWSDRLRASQGRRGMLMLGVLLMLAGLALFGASRSLALIVLAYLIVQVAASLAQAAQQGYIPDLVPEQLRGLAAGCKGLMDLGGALLGFVVLGALLARGQLGLALLVLAAVLAGTLLLTIVLVREPPGQGGARAPQPSLADAFRIDLRQHHQFAWLVVSRFLFLLGNYAVGRFLLFFVADRLRLDPGQAAEQAGALLGGLTLMTVVAALPSGWAADRWGRVPLMIAGSVLSATSAALLGLAGTALAIFLAGSLMAIGSAAFTAGNWAFVVDVLPADRGAHFLGLANIGTAGAAAAAGLFGPLVDWANARAAGAGYTVLFAGTALAFLGSLGALYGVRVLPTARAHRREPDLVDLG